MAKAYDILLDEDGDLLIKDGDFVVGPSDEQHIEHILLAQPGEFKDFPMFGVGIASFLNAPFNGQTKQALERAIAINLESDGYEVESITINSLEDIQIKAFRK